jgi:hypothetical protein
MTPKDWVMTMTEGSGRLRTDANPFDADDQTQQHLKRAMELVEVEARSSGSVDNRTLYDAMTHLRAAAVMDIVDGDGDV